MPYDTIDYFAADGIARITLNRPERLNAINTQLVADLRAAVAAANDDHSVRVMILSGAGRAFCAGYDLDWGTKGEDAIQRAMGGMWDPVRDYVGMSRNVRAYMALWESPKPIIAQVHGWCVGGGTDMALCSDLIFMAEDAQIGYPRTHLGRAYHHDVGLPPRPRARQAPRPHRRIAHRHRCRARRPRIESRARRPTRR